MALRLLLVLDKTEMLRHFISLFSIVAYWIFLIINPIYFSSRYLQAQSLLSISSTFTLSCKNLQKNPPVVTHDCDPVQATKGQLQ